MSMETNSPTQESTHNQYSQPPTLEQPKKQRGFLLPMIGIVVLVIIVGAGTYYIGIQKDNKITSNEQKLNTQSPPSSSPVPSSISSELKTYQGQYFSFQYPKDWPITKQDSSSVTLQKEEQLPAQGAYPAQTLVSILKIYSEDVSSDLSLQKWLEKSYFLGGDENLRKLTIQSAKKITTAGVDALAVQVPGSGGYIDQGTVFIYKGRGYHISIIGAEIPGSSEAYQTITNSFKFAP